MKTYTVEEPKFSESLPITETTDTSHADNINAGPKQAFENTLYLKAAKVDGDGGDVSNTEIKTAEDISDEFPIPDAGDSSKTFLGKTKKFFGDVKNWMTGVCLLGQIVNNCVTDNPNLPLSAAQGKALQDALTKLNGDKAVKYTRIELLTDYSQIQRSGFYSVAAWSLKTIDNSFEDSGIGDFYILKLDPDYKFGSIIVTSPRFKNYFWIGRIWENELSNFRKI